MSGREGSLSPARGQSRQIRRKRTWTLPGESFTKKYAATKKRHIVRRAGAKFAIRILRNKSILTPIKVSKRALQRRKKKARKGAEKLARALKGRRDK